MESMIEELTGRAGKIETRKQCVKGYGVQTFYEECILLLNYELDLSGLNSEFKHKNRPMQTLQFIAKIRAFITYAIT